jgi:hypothetical protein
LFSFTAIKPSYRVLDRSKKKKKVPQMRVESKKLRLRNEHTRLRKENLRSYSGAHKTPEALKPQKP